MNALVVDTSSWISYFKGTPNEDLDLGLKEGRVFVPSLVVSELLSARMKPSEKQALISLLKELPLCDTSFEHWVRVGELRFKMSVKGLSLSTPDAHIAQSCLDLNGYLLSEDGVFKKVAGMSSLRLL